MTKKGDESYPLGNGEKKTNKVGSKSAERKIHCVLTCLCHVQPMQYATDSHACMQIYLNGECCNGNIVWGVLPSEVWTLFKKPPSFIYTIIGSISSLCLPFTPSLLLSISLISIQYRIYWAPAMYSILYCGIYRNTKASVCSRFNESFAQNRDYFIKIRVKLTILNVSKSLFIRWRTSNLQNILYIHTLKTYV